MTTDRSICITSCIPGVVTSISAVFRCKPGSHPAKNVAWVWHFVLLVNCAKVTGSPVVWPCGCVGHRQFFG